MAITQSIPFNGLEDQLGHEHHSSQALVEFYLNRIKEMDEGDGGINAVTWINPDAGAIGARMDDVRKNNSAPRPLHGVPFIVKDNINLAGTPTTGGSAALSSTVAREDADVVKRLKEAGAFVIAKANMSELALSYGRLGYSSTGGVTKNPRDVLRNASGSSSGSAAAVAAGFAPLALGTDTAGSIRAPASATGVVGLKPTHGLVSIAGILPLSPTLDVVGPIAPTVLSAAIALKHMISVNGRNTRDLSEAIDAFLNAPDKFISPQLLTIGVVSPLPSGNPDVSRAVQAAVNSLSDRGATIVELKVEAISSSSWPLLRRVIELEFRSSIIRFLQTLENAPPSLEEIVRLSANDGRINPSRLSALRDDVARRPASKAELAKAIADLTVVRSEVENLFQKHNLDFLVFPTMACPASPLFDQIDDRYSCSVEDPYTAAYAANASGFPELTVPAGATRYGLPIGMSIMGMPYSEARLFGIGHLIESLRKAKKD